MSHYHDEKDMNFFKEMSELSPEEFKAWRGNGVMRHWSAPGSVPRRATKAAPDDGV